MRKTTNPKPHVCEKQPNPKKILQKWTNPYHLFCVWLPFAVNPNQTETTYLPLLVPHRYLNEFVNLIGWYLKTVIYFTGLSNYAIALFSFIPILFAKYKFKFLPNTNSNEKWEETINLYYGELVSSSESIAITLLSRLQPIKQNGKQLLQVWRQQEQQK